MKKKIGVLGGGSWGTALAILLANKGHDLTIWLRDREQKESMEEERINLKYLPDVLLPQNIHLTLDLEEAIYKKDAIILSVGTSGVREVLTKAKTIINPQQIIINVSKGIENHSLMRISEIVDDIIPNNKYAVLSGPTHAEEVARNIPTAIVSASKDRDIAEFVQELFFTPDFRVYTNPDVIGVELGGSLKNVIALGAGISDGLGCGDNTKAALMTRGIFEMSRLGEKMGAIPETFFGLAGIGDLIVTCTSMHSRNRRAGILIGEGYEIDQAIKRIGMVVEGIKTTKSTYKLSEDFEIDMPITEEIHGIIYQGSDVKDSVNNLMARDKKLEMEDIVKGLNNLW